MQIDIPDKKIEYDLITGVSISGDLEKKDIEIDFVDFSAILDLSNNKLELCYKNEVLLQEPLPNRNTIYDFFSSIWRFFSCGFCNCCCNKEKTN
jgi:hypothetical protein